MSIYTSNYFDCKAGNRISISRDCGKDAGFSGKTILDLAPSKKLLKNYHANMNKMTEQENARDYITKYYNEVLKNVDIKQLLENENNPILLCYERNQEFCHRHVVAEYIEMMYGVEVKDIKVDENHNIEENKRPEYIKQILLDVIEKEKDRMNKKELLELLETVGIDKEEFWVLSSGGLTLREMFPSAGDLDIAVTDVGLEKLKEKYNLQPKGKGFYTVTDKIECVCDGSKENLHYKPEKVGEYYVQNIEEYYKYIQTSTREKDKARIPLVEKYIKEREEQEGRER